VTPKFKKLKSQNFTIAVRAFAVLIAQIDKNTRFLMCNLFRTYKIYKIICTRSNYGRFDPDADPLQRNNLAYRFTPLDLSSLSPEIV